MNRIGLFTIACSGLVPMAALAEVTGIAGYFSPNPVSTIQPSLGITYAIRTAGMFPSSSNSPVGTLGEVSMFAGDFAPGGYLPADGRLLSISGNSALFSLLGTTYGGDGRTSFALPDLRGRTAVGTGAGPALTPRDLGENFGSETLTLTPANLPSHNHNVPLTPTSNTTPTGAGQSFNNVQPSLGINYIIPMTGFYPGRGGSSPHTGSEAVLGFVYATAISYLRDGWTTASGQVLPINTNQALFSLLGTTYGGDGRTTFALPDLCGRAPVGVGSTQTVDLGDTVGTEQASLSVNQTPAHLHTIDSISIATGITGGNAQINNEQPVIGLHYIIATSGIYPSRDGSGTEDEPMFGQISLFAGNFAPDGWEFCNGQLKPIAQNNALFSILGTYYGGDGRTNFALPNLDNTLAVGTGTGPGLSSWSIGETFGTAGITLNYSQLPAHTHDATVPEPTCLALIGVGAGLLMSRRRRAM